MDITEYAKQQGEFLTAEDVKTNPTAFFVITSEGEMVENKFGNMRLHLQGEFNSIKKTFDISKTNSKLIVDKLGSDTKSWIGKKLFLETYKTRTSDGKMTDAINVKTVE